MNWQPESLVQQRSRGQKRARPTKLGQLAQSRRDHQGQFFTPEAVARLMYTIFATPMAAALARHPGDRLRLVDLNCGTGRLFGPANSDDHELYAADIDATVVEPLGQALAETRFHHEVLCAPMEQVRVRRMSVALLNPPFGLTLSSPHLVPMKGITTWGKFGVDSNALSHAYAIALGLGAADLVASIVPRSFEQEAQRIPLLRDRLEWIVTLPDRTFHNEGTEVSTALLVFGNKGRRRAVRTYTMEEIHRDRPTFPGLCQTSSELGQAKLVDVTTGDDSLPAIRKAVTGDRHVRIFRAGRRIGLRFSCGFTEARVKNAILRHAINPAELPHRLPDGVEFTGQGQLDIDTLLAQSDPLASFESVLQTIREADAEPKVDPQLVPYLRRRRLLDRIASTPYYRCAFLPGATSPAELKLGDELDLVAIQPHVLYPTRWDGPVVKLGSSVRIARVEAGFELWRGGKKLGVVELAEIERAYRPLNDARTAQRAWREIYPGRAAMFPLRAETRRREAKALGLDQILSWEFQFNDLIELTMTDRGLCGWCPAAGKSRLALSLCLQGHGKINLVVVESRLVDEMIGEWKKIPQLAPDDWQVIRSPADLDDLRRVNLISYERLRAPICSGAGRRTYARLLRHRIHTLVPDEAGVLANSTTAQSHALAIIGPKRRYGLDGTPIGNFCRDVVPVFAWSAGDGVAQNPFGVHRPYLNPVNFRSMKYAERGLDVFRERHMNLVWVTAQFEDGLVRGAKRETPFLRNVQDFREHAARNILRRQRQEPDVAKHLRQPVPRKEVHSIEFDEEHLALYLRVADEFASWYRDHLKQRGVEKGINLIAVLARIRAVMDAANAPSIGVGREAPYCAATAKERAAIDLIEQNTLEGHRTLLAAYSPRMCSRLKRFLKARGIDAVQCTGEQSISSRNRMIRDQFKTGDFRVLLATYGVIRRGHNLPEASRVLFFTREWTPDAEEQTGCRVLRAEQTLEVVYQYLHHTGSIDEYMAQHVEQKGDSIAAGLDWGEQTFDVDSFEHIDTLLNRFVENLEKRRGFQGNRFREVLKQGVAA